MAKKYRPTNLAHRQVECPICHKVRHRNHVTKAHGVDYETAKRGAHENREALTSAVIYDPAN